MYWQAKGVGKGEQGRRWEPRSGSDGVVVASEGEGRRIRLRGLGRVKDRYGLTLKYRTGLRHRYGGVTSKWWTRRAKRLKGRNESPRTALVADLECRSDVLLHRSGLAGSVGQARQRRHHGQVVWRKAGGEDWLVLRRPGVVRKVGDRRQVRREARERQVKRRSEDWCVWPKGKGRSVPTHREVDYGLGRVVLVERPSKAQVLAPSTRSWDRTLLT